MHWYWLIILLAAAIGVVIVVSRKRRIEKEKVDKYVCDVCLGSDCDCRREK
jgi:hypothetical protein